MTAFRQGGSPPNLSHSFRLSQAQIAHWSRCRTIAPAAFTIDGLLSQAKCEALLAKVLTVSDGVVAGTRPVGLGKGEQLLAC